MLRRTQRPTRALSWRGGVAKVTRRCRVERAGLNRARGYVFGLWPLASLATIANRYALTTNKNIWIDGSLRDAKWYTKVFNDIVARFPHYRIAIIHVHAPAETIYERAERRGEITGRFVPKDTLRQSIKARDARWSGLDEPPATPEDSRISFLWRLIEEHPE